MLNLIDKVSNIVHLLVDAMLPQKTQIGVTEMSCLGKSQMNCIHVMIMMPY